MLWEWEGFCSFTLICLEIFVCDTMQLYPLGNISVMGGRWQAESSFLYGLLLSRTYIPFYTDPDWRELAEGSFAVCLGTNVLFMLLSLDCGVSEKFASVQNVGLDITS